MLITIQDYCQQRNVSKQFVYEYIKKGKLTVLELPTFVEMDGEKVHLGMQKVLDVRDNLVPKPSDSKALSPLDSAPDLGKFVKEITENPFLQDFFTQYLSATDANQKKSFKQKFNEMLKSAENGPELSAEFDEVNIKIMQYMRKQSQQITEVLAENRKELATSNVD